MLSVSVTWRTVLISTKVERTTVSYSPSTGDNTVDIAEQTVFVETGAYREFAEIHEDPPF